MRRGASVVFVVLLALLAGAAVAEAPKVGPKDGMAVESLPALAIPSVAVAQKLVDITFPTYLEKMGDNHSALLEWQRVAYQSSGNDRQNALYRIALLQVKLEDDAAAAQTLTKLVTEFPASANAAQAYVLLAQTATGAQQASAIAAIRTSYADTAWGKAALMQLVWQQAAAGAVTQTYGLPQADNLKKRIGQQDLDQQRRATTATMLGIFPGAGHAYIGQVGQGLFLFLGWAVFTLAFLSACRHRHYAYAVVFVVPAVALWLNSPFLARAASGQLAAQQRTEALAKWQKELGIPFPGAEGEAHK